MKNLMKIAEEHNKAQKKEKSFNDLIFEALYEEKQKLTRQEVMNYITLKKLEELYGKIDEYKLKSLIKSGEYDKVYKTSKSSVYKLFAPNGKDNSFNALNRFKAYKLVKNLNKYTIKDK